MPQFHEAWNVERMRKGIKGKRSSGRTRSHTDSDAAFLRGPGDTDGESALPPHFRVKLHALFNQIEKEFESLYLENIALTERNELLERNDVAGGEQRSAASAQAASDVDPPKGKGQAQKIKPAQKLKVQTSRIVSSFRAPLVTCSLVSEFLGHRDGVWDVAASKLAPVIATASADQKAYIWNVESTRLISQYVGHSGSVNSVAFHPTQDLVLTASGDQTAHIWRPTVGNEPLANVSKRTLGQQLSSEEELEDDAANFFGASIGGDVENDDPRGVHKIANYLQIFRGHSGVVIAADWLALHGRVITASWDRTANLYDTETGDLILTLTGHDAELTHVCGHPIHQMAVTCSKDTTFRLWDFREPFHSVSVFQGHTEPVTSAVLLKDDRAVSGSDDRTVKVWDLRNMRSPQAAIQLDSPANRLAVNSSGVIAIPHDNRHIRLYDVTGQRLARLPRNSRQGHRRMVCSAAWAPPEQAGSANLFTCGFDRRVIGWRVVSTKEPKD